MKLYRRIKWIIQKNGWRNVFDFLVNWVLGYTSWSVNIDTLPKDIRAIMIKKRDNIPLNNMEQAKIDQFFRDMDAKTFLE